MISTNAGAVPARARLLLSPLVLICILGIGRHAAPQTTGSILGNVSDPSGAVVVNAKVTVKCTQGGLTRTAVSNASGSYILPQLPLGSYTLTVEGAGFEKYVNTAVMVDGDQNVRIDAMLPPGKITDQVPVSGAPPQVDTHSNMLSVIIPQELVNDMPTSTGQPIDFVAILPGVSNVSTSAAFAADRNSPTFNVSGSRSSDNLLLLDGVMHTNLYRNQGENYPPPDFLSKIEAVLKNYGAQYGHNTGAILNIL